jgi:hypothetical protein
MSTKWINEPTSRVNFFVFQNHSELSRREIFVCLFKIKVFCCATKVLTKANKSDGYLGVMPAMESSYIDLPLAFASPILSFVAVLRR